MEDHIDLLEINPRSVFPTWFMDGKDGMETLSKDWKDALLKYEELSTKYGLVENEKTWTSFVTWIGTAKNTLFRSTSSLQIAEEISRRCWLDHKITIVDFYELIKLGYFVVVHNNRHVIFKNYGIHHLSGEVENGLTDCLESYKKFSLDKTIMQDSESLLNLTENSKKFGLDKQCNSAIQDLASSYFACACTYFVQQSKNNPFNTNASDDIEHEMLKQGFDAFVNYHGELFLEAVSLWFTKYLDISGLYFSLEDTHLYTKECAFSDGMLPLLILLATKFSNEVLPIKFEADDKALLNCKLRVEPIEYRTDFALFCKFVASLKMLNRDTLSELFNEETKCYSLTPSFEIFAKRFHTLINHGDIFNNLPD